MRQIFPAVLVLLICGTAFGQVTQEEAAKRMAEKKAAREAQRAVAVTITQGEVDDLHAEISRLRAQVVQLQVTLANEKKAKAVVAAKEEAKAAKEKEDSEPITAAIKAHTLAIGMTLDQANRSLGLVGTKTGESKDGEEYSWPILKVYSSGGNGTAIPSRHGMSTTHYRKALFKDGALVEFHTDE